jgi:hypothetical protein
LPAVTNESLETASSSLEEELASLLEFIAQARAELIQQAAPKKYFEEDAGMNLYEEMNSVSISIGQGFSEQLSWQMTVSVAQLKALKV